jgi:hypothetical protein
MDNQDKLPSEHGDWNSDSEYETDSDSEYETDSENERIEAEYLADLDAQFWCRIHNSSLLIEHPLLIQLQVVTTARRFPFDPLIGP